MNSKSSILKRNEHLGIPAGRGFFTLIELLVVSARFQSNIPSQMMRDER